MDQMKLASLTSIYSGWLNGTPVKFLYNNQWLVFCIHVIIDITQKKGVLVNDIILYSSPENQINGKWLCRISSIVNLPYQ